ncbi:MAG: hypothetical protein ABI885_07540 [Gammaproteobacteria bacterium]
MSADDWVWDILELQPTDDAVSIRRAYARQLKKTHPEDDPNGFQALRAAYEIALAGVARRVAQLAHAGLDAEEAVDAEPLPRPRSAPSISPTRSNPRPRLNDGSEQELLALLQHLRGALVQETPIEIHELRAAFDSVALQIGRVGIEAATQCERNMAQLILQTSPRSDSLLEPAISHFGWDKLSLGWKTHTMAEAVCSRARALQFVRSIEDRESPMSRALRLLRNSPRTWRNRFAMIWSLSLEGEVAALLRHLHTVERSALSLMNAQALEWWRTYFGKPRLRPAAVAVASLLLVLGVLLGTGYLRGRGLPGGTAAAGALGLSILCVSTFLGGKLWAVDWPRHVLTRYTQHRAFTLAWYGWIPLSLVLPLIAVAFPASTASRILISCLSVAALAWAVWVRRPHVSPPSSVNPFVYQLALNVPLGILVGSLLTEHSDASNVQIAVAIAGAVVSHGFATQPLAVSWAYSLDTIQRAWGLSLMLAATAALLVATIFNENPAMSRALAVATLIMVLIHRVPSNLLSGQVAIRTRIYGSIALWAIAGVLMTLFMPSGGDDTRLLSAMLLSGIPLTLGVCGYYELRARRITRHG